MTSSLLPHPPAPGGPAATYGGTRADRTREHPTGTPAEDEVSAASQWLGHARFAHGARCALGLAPSDTVDLHTILRVCTPDSTSGDSQTHSTHSPSAHTLLHLHTRLAVCFRDSWASQTCQSHSHGWMWSLDTVTQAPPGIITCTFLPLHAYPLNICHSHTVYTLLMAYTHPRCLISPCPL